MANRSQWSCGARLWLEYEGRVVLGKGRVELLEAIDEHKSIRQAAARIRMSYRRAWLLVQRMNEASDTPLVESSTGGRAGGGARVTGRGHAVIKIYRQVERTVERSATHVLASLRDPSGDVDPQRPTSGGPSGKRTRGSRSGS